MSNKPRGFIDFDLQMARKDTLIQNCHHKRFDPFELFPKNYSNSRVVQNVIFDKQLPRDDKGLYNKNMIDSNIVVTNSPEKPRGILQFGKMYEKRQGIIKEPLISNANKKQKNKLLIK